MASNFKMAQINPKVDAQTSYASDPMEIRRIYMRTHFEPKNKKIWEEFKAGQVKDYSKMALIGYVSRWAKYMQYYMAKENKTLTELGIIGKEVCDLEGKLCSADYEAAEKLLVNYWRYGEEFAKLIGATA